MFGTSGFETTEYRMNKQSIFPWKVELDSGPRVLSYKILRAPMPDSSFWFKNSPDHTPVPLFTDRLSKPGIGSRHHFLPQFPPMRSYIGRTILISVCWENVVS